MQKQRRALILYATMTKNTEKIARWFRETFESYKWEVTMYRIKNNMDIDEMQPHVYFDDYDVVCLGSPIVAGYPLKAVSKHFGLGTTTGLEEQTAANIEGGGFHARMWDKPGPRDEAKALIGDLVEDYFCSFNGERNMVGSQYISIS